jgi:predicted protein tyrosine phosphatase
LAIKHVIFTSKKEAERRAGWDVWAVISITDFAYTEHGSQAKLKEGWFDILRLEFDDITAPQEPYVLFSAQQAREIIEFVQRCNDEKLEGILVHCRAGISRSAAVAKWVSDKYNLAFPENYDQYNLHVYQVLREEHLLKDFD